MGRRLKNLFKYPILSYLILLQILAIVIGLSILSIGYYTVTQGQLESSISKIKDTIKPSLRLKQEEWRTWEYLKLHDALNNSLENFKKKHNLESLKIVAKKNIPTSLSSFDIIVPENPKFVETFVHARISDKEIQSLSQGNQSILWLILLLGIILVGVVILSGQYIKRKMYQPIQSLNEAFMKSQGDQELEIDQIQASGEVQQFLNYAQDLYQKTRDTQRMAIMGQVASQVAHDIRSPLAALRMSISNLPELSEEKRLLVRRAVQRIDDITNDLSDKNKRIQQQLKTQSMPHLTETQEDSSIQLISSLVESLVSEKRVQYRLNPNVEIVAHLDQRSYGIFAKLKASELKRVLSNLINNAVEATKKKGEISLTLQANSDNLILKIVDSGKGIAPENIKTVLEKGVSIGKKSGSGLGLYHAAQTLKLWGGSLEVQSQPDIGTCISLKIPRSPAPDWFIPQLDIFPDTQIVVLDDDQSIHAVWDNRLEQAGLASNRCQHFSSCEQFEKWHSKNKNQPCVFLIDFELLGSHKTGLEIIKDQNIIADSVLVTSRYEDPDIIDSCKKLNLKLLPKALAEFLPIHIQNNPAESLFYDYILIDDDEIVHTFWKIEAKSRDKKIGTFTNPQDFFKIRHQIAKDTPIYIDAHLGKGSDGQTVSRQLNKWGFTNLYIATGKESYEIPELPWIKAVVGKTPPYV